MMQDRAIILLDHDWDMVVELLQVAKAHCLDLAMTVARTVPHSPLVERMRCYAEQADELMEQIMERSA